MKEVSIQNKYGETIRVQRGLDKGLLVNHSGLDFTSDGEFVRFVDVELRIGGKASIGGFLARDGETQVVNGEEGRLIRRAARRLPDAPVWQ